ncbi:MAG: AAA family ATPase [Campylobacterota bacterium]|nr:AAA family ATPase [Campylobacterota bacterium]
MMKACSYHFDENNKNLHHLEKNIWSHTLKAYNLGLKNLVNTEVLWALLLHDIGRVYTRKTDAKKQHVSFGDFEGVSCFVALHVLNKTDLTDEQKIKILKIISYQYVIIDHIKYNNPSIETITEKFLYEEELLINLAQYVRCDLFSRIVDSTKQYLYDFQKSEESIYQIGKIKKNSKKISKKNNTVYILVGPPCSKKSSWTEKQKGEFIIICRDNYTQEIGNKYNKNTYDEAYKLMQNNKNVAQEVYDLEKKHETLAKKSKNQNIIIDNPNLDSKNRKEWIDACNKTHNIKVILFLTSLNDLIRCSENRSNKINKSLDKDGYISKLKSFTFPLLNEGIDNIEYIFNL